ncbi:MAG TPA: FAD-binding oxidoreductase [Pirellulales bacterium]
MTVAAANLPLTETFAPASQQELAQLVTRAKDAGTPLYPLGGGTGLSFGLTARRPGWGIATSELTRIVDYPARDMTITVEAGITFAALASELAREGQRLPIDVPQSVEATLGGVVATAVSGPRRFGYGSMRDYVIGISAVDGRGVPFKAGGRVVKNVAGYDFCKLLTGSRGALGVITQVTLKLLPLAVDTAFVVCDVTDLRIAEGLLAALVNSETAPVAIELLTGPLWAADPVLGSVSRSIAGRLVVGLEGTEAEVTWMTEQLSREWRALGVQQPRVIRGAEAGTLWSRLVEFPVADDPPLVVKASVLPSRLTQFVESAIALDPECSIQAHAGKGTVKVRCAEFAAADTLRILVRGLRPAAVKAGGNACVYACPASTELTHQAVWGPMGSDAALMRAVKSKLDPQGLLNPGLAAFEC